MAERSSRSGKKVVQAESAPAPATTAKERAAIKAEADKRVREGDGWKASDSAKSGATTKRVIAFILWGLAIAAEGVGIWYLLTQLRGTNVDGEPNTGFIPSDYLMWALIGLLVFIGILTVIGSQLWKAANQADPASRQEAFRYFVQNQLGAIITIIAFVPIIILILLNKNLDSRTKGIAGAVGAVVLVVAVLLNIEWNPASVEENTEEVIEGEIANEGQIDEYTAIVTELTGDDEVAWTLEGKVYHLCEDTSAVSQDSADGRIFTGSVADAHAAGKAGLTLQVDQEMEQCGLTDPANLDEIEAEIEQLRDAYELENAG
ncbi:hypothetical protein [Pseudolysinimonas yzui]|uniref:Uncharacterized protein n=1 Tax=Pseudolysinimonas yzui TaxID=2708254 RepID=A0A8J3M4W3_9MICO|nr:hypothetical protein [Pseudolysinimonas yzui]GHF18259.1 hypothetical protein GCM10011600_18990 [Pseudolysinimonas yzui]